MPHMTIEYSSNLAGRADMQTVANVAREALLATQLFEQGALRVRAIECNVYAIADRHPENAFVDISLRVGMGRSDDEKRAAGELIYSAMLRHFETLLASPYFALSFEVREIDAALSWKTNAMHKRLRGNSY